eukprot:Gb_06934 [translate_table: standard]
MSSLSSISLAQDALKHSKYWRSFVIGRSYLMETNSVDRVKGGETLVSVNEPPSKVRKPYTITKQRERWTEDEHQKFLEALKLYGRAWRHIEEHIGTKSAVQIRSHAQKFFTKLEKEASTGILSRSDQDLEIPPPRPKRKPGHPYPKKAGGLVREGGILVAEEDTQIEGCEVLNISSGSLIGDRECSETAAFAQHNSNTKLLNKQKMTPGTSQSPQMPTRLRLFGQTLVIQDSVTDMLCSTVKKEVTCSEILSEDEEGSFHASACDDEISDCRMIRNDPFSPEESDIDTFQSGDTCAGSGTIPKSSVVANRQCSCLQINSCHSALSEEIKVGNSHPKEKTVAGNMPPNLGKCDELEGTAHSKDQDSYNEKQNYFHKSHVEDEKHKSKAQTAFEASLQFLSSQNTKEVCCGVLDHCKMLPHPRKTVLENGFITQVTADKSCQLTSASNSNSGDPCVAKCSMKVTHPETNMDSSSNFRRIDAICESVDIETGKGMSHFFRPKGSNLSLKINGQNKKYSGAGFVPYKQLHRNSQVLNELNNEKDKASGVHRA